MKKVLFLCPRVFHERKLSRPRFYYMEALARRVTVAYDGPGFPGWVDCPAAVLKHHPDLIVWYKPLDMAGHELIADIPKVLIYNEMYDVSRTEAEITASGTGLVICHHQNDLPRYAHMDARFRFVHIPHHVNTEVFRPSGKPKTVDILLAGVQSPDIYPLRARFAALLPKLSHWKTAVHKHPGYRPADPAAHQAAFAAALSSARIVLTCSSTYGYALAKYAEVMACGSAVGGDVPAERQEWFRDHIIELDLSMTDAEMVDRLDWWLSRPADLAILTMVAQAKTRDTLNTDAWVDRFLAAVKDA